MTPITKETAHALSLAVVAKVYNVPVFEITNRRRSTRPVSHARNVAMFLARRVFGTPFNAAADMFGRSPSHVHSGVAAIDKVLANATTAPAARDKVTAAVALATDWRAWIENNDTAAIAAETPHPTDRRPHHGAAHPRCTNNHRVA